MYPVIEAGGVNYDAVCPSDYMIQKMTENDLLAELNFDNIPNMSTTLTRQYMEMSKQLRPGKQILRAVHLGNRRYPLQYEAASKS